MNIPTPGDSPKNDSAAYKLLNLLYCAVLENDKRLIVNYWHKDNAVQSLVRFEDLYSIHTGLPAAVMALHRTSDLRNNEFAVRLNVTLQHYFGNYVELHADNGTDLKYPFLTNIKHVCTSIYPDEFSVAASRYKLNENTFDGLALVDIDGLPEQLISIKLLETVWPDCGKHIPMMESIGFDDAAVVAMLLNGSQVDANNINPYDVKFE